MPFFNNYGILLTDTENKSNKQKEVEMKIRIDFSGYGADEDAMYKDFRHAVMQNLQPYLRRVRKITVPNSIKLAFRCVPPKGTKSDNWVVVNHTRPNRTQQKFLKALKIAVQFSGKKYRSKRASTDEF